MNKKQLTVKKLDINNLADVMKLQEKIISGLHPDEQHFILHRTAEDYMKSLNGKSSNMLGVFDGDTLIAQTVYSLPLNGETRDMPEFKPQIAVDNPASWINALHHGMAITKVDRDPYDSVKVIYLEKKISHKPAPVLHAANNNAQVYSMYLGDNIHAKIPSLFHKMQYLIQNGYHGVSLNKESKSLVWEKQTATRNNSLSFGYMLKDKAASF